MTENEIGKIVIDASIKLHKELGCGLLETVYEVILARELERQKLKVQRQVIVPIEYDGIKFNEAFRADIIVEISVFQGTLHPSAARRILFDFERAFSCFNAISEFINI